MGQIVFQATLGGQVAVAGPNTASSFTLTLPAATDTLVGKATTDTLTNKTLTSPVISGGTINNATIGATTATTGKFTAVTNSALTSGRVTYAGASGLLTDSAALTFDGSNIVVNSTTPAYFTGTSNLAQISINRSPSTGAIFNASQSAAFINIDGVSGGSSIQFATATANNTQPSEAMRINSSGNVGIGTSSPSVKLHVDGTGTQYIRLSSTTNSNFVQSFCTSGSTGQEYKSVYRLVDTDAGERMRIDSSGNLLLGTTSNFAFATSRLMVSYSTADFVTAMQNSNANPFGTYIKYSGAAPNGTSNEFIYCHDGSLRFSVMSNGGISNYATNNVILSDRREKTNFAPAKSYLDVICAIPVQTFNYIDQNLETDAGLTLGVTAQDVQAVAPELVTEGNWGSKENPKMRLEIYQTDMQYALMKCIQEQQALIESLTTRLTALENK